MILRYVCAVCGGTYVDTDSDATDIEALTTFTPAELEHTSILCDTCWHELRERVPELDARYKPRDVYEQFLAMRRALRLETLTELHGLVEAGVELSTQALGELITEVERSTSPVIEL